MFATFIAAKFIFFLNNGFPSFGDTLDVLLHGLPLDLNIAAYTSAPLWLGALTLLWINNEGWLRILRRAYRVYTALLGVLVVVILIVDTVLYEKWSFKLDAVCLSYLDNPSGVTDSLPTVAIVGGLMAFVLLVSGYVWCLWHLLPKDATLPATPIAPKHRWTLSGVYLLVGAILFLAIRGGVTQSTANVGMVYFSPNQYLNHSAVNPAFSFFYSLMKNKDYSKTANYFSPEEATRLAGTLQYNTESELLPTDSLLTTTRPNVLLILMEGCGGRVVGCTEGSKGVTPNLDDLAANGIFFANCYANSFRTDRGIICAFSGYPAFPDASVMKMPAKSRVLPSIAGALKAEGYATQLMYGGDKNFTNMNSYFLATGYDRVLGDVDFPEPMRRTHIWGVTDHLMFPELLKDIRKTPSDRPWMKTLITLSSHEPWEVPHKELEDPILNSFRYLDKSLGDFINSFRHTPQWENTLVIILPDHGVGWPVDINEFDTRKYHIPMIWTGGAVKSPRRIEQLCNQTDLAATLLGQMGIDHTRFPFSRDVLSQTYTHPCAFHAWPEGYTLIDTTGVTTYEVATRTASKTTPDPTGVRLNQAKAFMQKAYEHLDALK